MQLYTKVLIGMLIGILAGFVVGPNAPLMPQNGVKLSGVTVLESPDGSVDPLAANESTAVLTGKEETLGDKTYLEVEYRLSSTDKMKLEQGGTLLSVVIEDSQTSWILDATDEGAELQTFSTLGVGLVNSTVWIGKLFLALIKMVVIPLVFCSLVVGVASLGDFRKLG